MAKVKDSEWREIADCLGNDSDDDSNSCYSAICDKENLKRASPSQAKSPGFMTASQVLLGKRGYAKSQLTSLFSEDSNSNDRTYTSSFSAAIPASPSIPQTAITSSICTTSQMPATYEEENSQVKRRKYLESELKSTFCETSAIQSTNSLTLRTQFNSQMKQLGTPTQKVQKQNLNTTSLGLLNLDWSNETDNLVHNMSINEDDFEEAPTDKENSFYGLPLKVKELLKSLRNISCLYDWQHDLLTRMQQKPPQTNLLYLSPTSGGKTLVAEMLILETLLVKKKNCIFIMPFVSIVQEKVHMMEPFSESLRFHVEEYAGVKGSIPPIKRQVGMNRSTLYICTIEKAHSLINSLIETDRLTSEIGLVVADELHMIGDGPRGATFEMILAKVKYCSDSAKKKVARPDLKPPKKDEKPFLGIQIVATTATLQNKKELAEFLDAFLYERDFRPVELKEYIKLDKQIFEIDKTKLNQILDDGDSSFAKLDRQLELIGYTGEMKTADPDGLIALVKEVIPNDSCLIFCPTKKNCENVAALLSKYLPKDLEMHKREQKLKLLNELIIENSTMKEMPKDPKERPKPNICPVLRKCLAYGVAYHHSGLTTEERQLLEQAFREGVICLITCTSTLAAGVNLPARRVIIRSPYVARDFISTHQYKQMIGRAGRAGLIDCCGESILIFQNVDRRKVYELVSGPMKRCESSFNCDDAKAIRILVLSLIGLSICNSGSEVLNFFKQTLFYIQQKSKMAGDSESIRVTIDESTTLLLPKEFEYIFRALIYLVKKKFIGVKASLLDLSQTSQSSRSQSSICNETIENISLSNPNDVSVSSTNYQLDDEIVRNLFIAHFEVTRLGMAAIKGAIDLDYVHMLYSDLQLGLKTMVLSNYLHLLYLCTPYDLVNNLTTVDFDTYYKKYSNLTEDEKKCASVIGVSENYITKKRFQSNISGKKYDEGIHKRFYMTLIIYDLWKSNNSLWDVSTEFQLDRGFVQSIIQSSASFTSGVLHFCENIDELWPYKNLLQEFTKRLQYNCSSLELVPLLEIDNVRLPRARQLFNAGYKTLDLVAAANADEMSKKIINLQPAQAKRMIKSANKILKEKAELLQNEAANLLLQINNTTQAEDTTIQA